MQPVLPSPSPRPQPSLALSYLSPFHPQPKPFACTPPVPLGSPCICIPHSFQSSFCVKPQLSPCQALRAGRRPPGAEGRRQPRCHRAQHPAWAAAGGQRGAGVRAGCPPPPRPPLPSWRWRRRRCPPRPQPPLRPPLAGLGGRRVGARDGAAAVPACPVAAVLPCPAAAAGPSRGKGCPGGPGRQCAGTGLRDGKGWRCSQLAGGSDGGARAAAAAAAGEPSRAASGTIAACPAQPSHPCRQVWCWAQTRRGGWLQELAVECVLIQRSPRSQPRSRLER